VEQSARRAPAADMGGSNISPMGCQPGGEARALSRGQFRIFVSTHADRTRVRARGVIRRVRGRPDATRSDRGDADHSRIC